MSKTKTEPRFPAPRLETPPGVTGATTGKAEIERSRRPLTFLAACALLGVSLGLAVLAASCGGGGVLSDGGISGSGLVVGPIEDFGSIFVDGIELDTTGAIILVNGEQVDQSALGLGMMVAVDANVDDSGVSGAANEVVFDHVASGPIDSWMPTMKRLRILGQTVFYDEDTVFAGLSVVDLALGVPVNVSGFIDGNDEIQASRIAKSTAGGLCRAAGRIRNLSPARDSFSIRALNVDASAATIIGGALKDGEPVAVSARSCDGGLLRAETVRLLAATAPNPAGRFRNLQGVIVERSNAGEFLMRLMGRREDLRVRISTDTVFINGSAADLQHGVRATVTGRLEDGGFLNALRIRIMRFGGTPLGLRAATARAD